MRTEENSGDSSKLDVSELLLRIEQQTRHSNAGRELLYGFVFLIVVHNVGLLLWSPRGGRPATAYTWVVLGGLGTLAVWFACAARPLSQRIARLGIAIVGAMAFRLRTIAYIAMPQQGKSGFRAYPRLSAIPETPPDATTQILLCWLIGAMTTAFVLHWFFGMRLLPPDRSASDRKPFTLQSIFMLTIFAALISLYIRGPNWQNRISYFSNGATLGLVASAIAYGVFTSHTWILRIGVPVAAVTIVVVGDIVVGGLLGMWGGSIFDRLGYVVTFATSLCVSPVLSFALLKQLGYGIRFR